MVVVPENLVRKEPSDFFFFFAGAGILGFLQFLIYLPFAVKKNSFRKFVCQHEVPVCNWAL